MARTQYSLSAQDRLDISMVQVGGETVASLVRLKGHYEGLGKRLGKEYDREIVRIMVRAIGDELKRRGIKL